MSVKAVKVTKKKSLKEQEKIFEEMWTNPMKKPYLEKVVLNIGVLSLIHISEPTRPY